MSYRKRKAAADDFFISPDFLATLKLDDDEPIDYMNALWQAEAIALGATPELSPEQELRQIRLELIRLITRVNEIEDGLKDRDKNAAKIKKMQQVKQR
jgi:hypothetical protein